MTVCGVHVRLLVALRRRQRSRHGRGRLNFNFENCQDRGGVQPVQDTSLRAVSQGLSRDFCKVKYLNLEEKF